MIKLVAAIFIFILHFHQIEMMSEAQMRSTTKLMRNVCQPKNKVSNDQIESMHKGIWDDARETMCYMFCVLQMMKVVNKQGVLDYDFAIKQSATLPTKYQEPTYKSMDECRNSQTESDPCSRSYQFAKCIYLAGPEFYFLP